MFDALLIPEVYLIFKLVGRRDVSDDFGYRTLAPLVLAFGEDGARQRVGKHSLGLVGVGKDRDLAHTAGGDIFLEFRIADLLLDGCVVDIEHREEKHYYNGIGPVHAETYTERFLGFLII